MFLQFINFTGLKSHLKSWSEPCVWRTGRYAKLLGFLVTMTIAPRWSPNRELNDNPVFLKFIHWFQPWIWITGRYTKQAKINLLAISQLHAWLYMVNVGMQTYKLLIYIVAISFGHVNILLKPFGYFTSLSVLLNLWTLFNLCNINNFWTLNWATCTMIHCYWKGKVRCSILFKSYIQSCLSLSFKEVLLKSV